MKSSSVPNESAEWDPDAVQLLIWPDGITAISHVTGAGGRDARPGTGSFKVDGERVLSYLRTLAEEGLIVVSMGTGNGWELLDLTPTALIDVLRTDWTRKGHWEGFHADKYWVAVTHKGRATVERWMRLCEDVEQRVSNLVVTKRMAKASLESLAHDPEVRSAAAERELQAVQLVAGIICNDLV